MGEGLKVDFHSHYLPKGYLKRLESSTVHPRVEADEAGRRFIVGSNVREELLEELYQLDRHIAELDRFGVDLEAISVINIWDDFIDVKENILRCRLINDGVAEAVGEHPNRLVGLASIPLVSPQDALEELERAVRELGLKGVILKSHVDGRPLDSPEFLPVYDGSPSWAFQSFYIRLFRFLYLEQSSATA